MGTATLEANMEQHLARLAHEPIFHVLLEVCKAYDSIDRGRCLEILGRAGSKHGPPTNQLLGTIEYCTKVG